MDEMKKILGYECKGSQELTNKLYLTPRNTTYFFNLSGDYQNENNSRNNQFQIFLAMSTAETSFKDQDVLTGPIQLPS